MTEDRPVCPDHGIPDCSPLLNGCSRLTTSPDTEAAVEIEQAADKLAARIDDEEKRQEARRQQLEALTRLGYTRPFSLVEGFFGIVTEGTSCLRCGAVIALSQPEEGQRADLYPLQIHINWHAWMERAVGSPATGQPLLDQDPPADAPAEEDPEG